ncbi:MAG: phosphate starvation-inducible protein PhoH [Cryomorphaceae bacterium MED-G14]|nr:MAG: phosphate starvation-inducible protein PhoH [Cryomorphaceae bacterium MED-G14]
MEKFEYYIKEIHPSDFFNSEIDIIKNLRKKFKKLKFISKGDKLIIEGQSDEIIKVCVILDNLIYFIKNENINESNIIEILNGNGDKLLRSENGRVILYGVNKKKIKAHTLNQIKLVESFERNDMVFAIGPAGTGKTYTGIAIAVKALKSKIVKRIILTRPAVEAGENLGFLPGDLKDKLDPYMQPLYDALKEMIPVEKLEDYIKRGIIEIAPLAYMRGRTLDNAFVILDEGQNTTHNQMKMFLTRMGKSAKFMITGDPGQIDLPRSAISGLKEANIILQNIEGIDIVYLDDKDVIRHKVVKKIIEAYKKTEHAN